MSGSVIQIFYNGTDITNRCLIDRCWFEAQLNAIPGTCELTVKDPDQSLSFVTGKEIVFLVDGTRTWAGFLMQIGRTHAFPADDTSDIESYDSRLWTLRGVDYNILFDKRVVRQTSNYLTQLSWPGTTMDGDLLRAVTSSYSDLTNEYDTSQIDNINAVNQWEPTKPHAVVQGIYLRDVFNDMAKDRGKIYYIDANKKVHFHALEREVSEWGFSDVPNNAPLIAIGSGYQDATYGFREVEAVEDGSYIVNDALIWGGSAWTADGGGTVFARYQNEVANTTSTSTTYIQSGAVTGGSSIDTHGRWQYPEVRVGDLASLNQVKSRADSIINGPPGTDPYGQAKGLRYSQWTFNFTWFANRVPTINGVRRHLVPGKIVTIEMNVFGITKLLPLRTLRATFPGGASDGTTYVQFTGEFGLQNSDPISLWTFLLNAERAQTTSVVATSNDDSSGTTLGAIGTFTPTPVPDGMTTLFTIKFGYISGTLRVMLNGLEQRSGIDFTETDGGAGTFTMTSAPFATDYLEVICRTLAG